MRIARDRLDYNVLLHRLLGSGTLPGQSRRSGFFLPWAAGTTRVARGRATLRLPLKFHRLFLPGVP